MRGGVPINRGALFHLLRNRLYLGEIPHKDQSYPGQHPAIVDHATFDMVQAKLDETAARPRTPDGQRRATRAPNMLLTGLIFDSAGKPMSPVKSQRKGGAAYRYYVSTAHQVGNRNAAGACPRIPAPLVEQMVADRLKRLDIMGSAGEAPDWTKGRQALDRITIGDGQLIIAFSTSAMPAMGSLAAMRRRLPEGDVLAATDTGLVLTLPLVLARTPGGVIAMGPHGRPAMDRPKVDKTLYASLIRAEAWKRRLLDGEVANVEALAKEEAVTASFVARLMRVAFLAPDLKRAVLDGRQPITLNLQAIMTRELPMDWSQQRALYRA